MTDSTTMDVDEEATNVLKEKMAFNIHYDTVNGVKTNPRIDTPDFTLGGLQFHLDARSVENAFRRFAVFIDLMEASKKTLMPGYEIEISEFLLDYVAEGGLVGNWKNPEPISVRDGLVFHFSTTTHCHSKFVMKFNDVFPIPLHFFDGDVANRKSSDCKIVLKDDGNKEVFVHKHILAFDSLFFQKLFFGEFKEKDEDVVKLGGVSTEDFLEYLCCVYPPPNRPLAFKRLKMLLCLADRFQNEALISSIKTFLAEKKDKTPREKNQTLVWADTYNMPKLFRDTLKTMDKKELKVLNTTAYKKFKRDNIELVAAHMIRFL